MKKIFLLTMVLCINIAIAQEKEGPKEGWTKKGNISLLLNQSAFNNWAAGGIDNIAGNLGLNYDFNYVKGNLTWDNKIIA
ncbi:MAG: DUF3078 domain-containing protein, partial [Lutibacter sp.]|nr:DUF3078 domain-containing protein [Lutibacter sp.]